MCFKFLSRCGDPETGKAQLSQSPPKSAFCPLFITDYTGDVC